MSNESTGRFVWHDLMTTDPKAARAFYSELFGYSFEERDMGPMGTYLMFSAGGKGVGGMMALDPAHGAPSHWMSYVTVDNVDAATKRAEAAGGKVAVPAMDIPDVGRFAVIADPQGGYISPFTSKTSEAPSDGPTPTGAFAWLELVTADPDAAKSFYEKVIGWSFRAQDMGPPIGAYHVAAAGKQEVAGIVRDLTPGVPAHWMPYLAVPDVDAYTTRAKTLRAKVYAEPMDVPEVGRFSVVSDPTGAVFALFKPAPRK